ncbi:tetratricopeptide repeat protein [Xylanibacter caecicola]|uniref:tetratricopeptide repeat protein n=1 Tax=Xylanibacter caecicola TaxID=2736294 RepID=UPI002585CD9A|nr:tetratricopeptide repeat protein [Xylanibacter caecicola]
MKKLMIMAIMACAATSTFAQDAVKQIMGAKDYTEAIGLIESSASSLSNEDKAKAYNKVVDLALAKFDKESQIALTNQVTKKNDPYDKEGMNKAALQALKAALECDKYDNMPNEKGKVKPKFRKTNATRLQGARASLINAGQDAFNAKDFNGAMADFGMYVDTKDAPLFAEGGEKKEDPYFGQISYFASLAAYNAQDFPSASRYAGYAMQDTASASDALDIKILSMKAQLKTKEDSLKYAEEVKELYNKDPKNDRFFALLTEYYANTGDNAGKAKLIEEQLVKNPESKMAWALKGEMEMGEHKWEDAIKSYKKSVELDPTFIQVLYNIGVCYNSKAIEFKNKEANERTGQLTPDKQEIYNNDLKESVSYLEKVRAQDPDRAMVNWAYTLFQAYSLLGDEAKAKEIEAILSK